MIGALIEVNVAREFTVDTHYLMAVDEDDAEQTIRNLETAEKREHKYISCTQHKVKMTPGYMYALSRNFGGG